ncbi:Lysine--tRNA ligase [Candidatus Entotheonellaceae bacterium PAL068K]
MSPQRTSHWADVIAQELAQSQHLLSTGITPSGEYHVGHLREVLTAEGVYRALCDQGSEAHMHYIADTMDPLRRVYDFLDPQIYAAEVGKPLCDIPCPCHQHDSYAEHFLEPFLAALRALGIKLQVLRAHELYRQGRLEAQIIMALQHTDQIKAILHEETGKAEGDDWSPYNPLCQACGRLTGTRLTGFDPVARTVSYTCGCGHAATAAISQAGKLAWRIDWPARWQALGVTVEPFGKDHATRGGSYDTGKRIIREVFGSEPPYPVPYEWLGLQGQGDMSSSKGNLVSMFNLTQTIPPEVVRYMIFRVKPSRRISFDPGSPLLNLVDEYDNPQGANRNQRAAELAHLEGIAALGIPFKHLVNLIQITQGDVEQIRLILQRNNLPVPKPSILQNRMAYAQHWLTHYCPPELRLQLQATVPEQVTALSSEQRQALGGLAKRLQADMDGDTIHTLVYGIAEEMSLAAKDVFQAIYIAFLDQPRGPRVGWFLSSLDVGFVRTRLQDAAASPPSS